MQQAIINIIKPVVRGMVIQLMTGMPINVTGICLKALIKKMLDYSS